MATRYNLPAIDREAFYRILLKWSKNGSLVDLTGYTATLTFTPSKETTPSITLTQAAGIVLGGLLGTIVIGLTADQTTALTVGHYQYSLRLTGPGGPKRFLEGNVRVR